MPGGKMYSAHSERDDYYQKHGIGPKEVYDKATASGHYWIVDGKPKPYYVTKMKDGRVIKCE
jgi:hypothetical protein